MSKYYSKFLSGERLKLCYDLAPSRVQQYLDAEINSVRERIKAGDNVLELGCGYGRILKELKSETILLYGIDNSFLSLQFGRNKFHYKNELKLFCMDAESLGFRENEFDLVFCVQNGISALGIEPALLIDESLRVTKPRGRILFSSYSDKFWNTRLDWFKIQSAHGLIGNIDYDLTGNGEIVCKDGFKATTFNRFQLENLTSGLERVYNIFEVDESSIFLEIIA